MSFLLSNRALLRAMLAGAVVLTGAACSRPDRIESGSDNSAAVLPDTSHDAAQPTGTDTATPQRSSAEPSSPRAETAAPADSSTAGYRSMERDTTDVSAHHADSATVTTEVASVDTTTGADTAATPSGDVVLQTTIDSSGQADANVSTEIGVAVADSADSTDSAGRIRPPEDSSSYEAVDETADEQIINPEDQETVAASETPTDEVGAAAVAGDVTGADAVALLSREGVRCALVDPEANEAARWDMSSTPVGLNPCGMGSMVLSRIWTEK